MAEIKLKTADGNNSVSLKGPASASSDVTLTLPNTDGGSNEYLKTDGNGALSWAAVSAGAGGDTELSLNDSVKIKLGTNDDFQLHHDDSNAYLKNSKGNIAIEGKAGEMSIKCVPDGAVELYHNDAKKVETSSAGISVTGNVVMADAGGGIDFAAESPSGAGSANTLLDDYEEGTWTPTIEFSGNAVGVTYSGSGQQGDYTKIGRQVTVHAHFQLTSKGSSTGWARLKGMPFSVAVRGSGSLGYYDGFDSSLDGAMQFLATTSTDIVLQETSSVNASSLADTHFSNTTRFYFTMTYETDT